MTTRRDFLRGSATAAAGVVFCGCGLLHRANAQTPARQTLPVKVAGKTDQDHRRALALPLPRGRRTARRRCRRRLQLPPVNGAPEAFIEIEKRLAAMDSQAIDMEVLSINPFWYDRDRDLAAQIVKIQNEKLAELCASKPDRFAAFASLTLQAPDLAVQELETAVKKQGLKGAAIGDVVNGMEFSDPKFNPVWAKAEELGVPLFIHPQGIAGAQQAARGQWLARQHDRQSAGHHDRAVASDLRRHVRPLSRPEGDRSAWRRLPAVLRRPLGPCLPGRSEGLQPRHHAEEAADRISQADLFRTR